MYNRIQKIILLFAALGWGISIFGVFLPWNTAVETLQGLGAGEIPADPMLNYWLRMAGGAFTMLGIIFFAILFSIALSYSLSGLAAEEEPGLNSKFISKIF